LPDGHDPAGSSAEAFMTPPFTSRRLLYRVKKLASTFPEHDIRAGSFALDPDTRTLRRG
jgi:DNA-binding response OmpR family regulator